MPLISDNTALQAFCERLKGVDYVTVDTEFLRETTYWPQLCLVQVASDDDAAVIDALAPGIDLQPVFDILADPDILKVFHAARQDMEIFYHMMGSLPAPIFDSQIAAMVCGFGDSVGYEQLVAKLVKAQVDKSSRFTDWSLRPLSDKQINYALSDVTHLRVAYKKLAKKLAENERTSWTNQEMEILTRTETYDGNPDNAFRRIKSRAKTTRFLAILREVTAWREREAQRRDVPRNRVLRDEALVEIAHHTPSNKAELGRTRGLGAKFADGRFGQEVLDAVARGKAVPDAECPELREKPEMPRGIGPITDMLKVLLKLKCDSFDVAAKLVTSSADIELIAAFGDDADVAALVGWRREMFGEDALKIRSGEFGLAVRGNKLVLAELKGE
ncbi:MAG: ribonuclease D [Rhodospirillales bacterium]|nr:ribonuclease D [Rhodospirillales bacterium]